MMSAPPRQPFVVVVPCYNEAERLDVPALRAFLGERPEAALILVDDGSTDGTRACLEALAVTAPERIQVLALARNQGKAEAVRQGMRLALGSVEEETRDAGGGAAYPRAEGPMLGVTTGAGARVVGYLDADLSTPTRELPLLLAALARPGVEVATGARVALLGRDIQRSAVRHYLGRVFASAASLILGAAVYDTQCGAKLFHATPALRAALDERFISRWAFDVELLGRLLAGTPSVAPLPLSAIVEVPLDSWRDVKGSKVSPTAMALTVKDLARIALDLAARRRAVESRFRT